MNDLAVSIGIILFPGLLASVICDKIATHSPKWGSFKYFVYSFIFGVTSYFLEQAAYTAYCVALKFTTHPDIIIFTPLQIWAFVATHKADINFIELIVATAMAPAVAIAATFLNNYKILNKFSQKIMISNKYGDENLFSFYLNSDEVEWVYVRDIETNQTYKGMVVSYSENDNIQELVLSDVTVYEYETSRELYSIPSIYISKKVGVFIIEQALDQPEDGGNDAQKAS